MAELSQALYDLLTPGGKAPALTAEELEASPRTCLLEVKRNRRSGRGRWWGPDSAGYTDQLDRAGLYGPESSEVANWAPEHDNYVLVDAQVIQGPLQRLSDMSAALDGEATPQVSGNGDRITPAGETSAECLEQVRALLEPKGYEVTLSDVERTMFHMRGLRLKPIEIRGYGVYIEVAPYQAELSAGGTALAWRIKFGSRAGDLLLTSDDLRMALVRSAVSGVANARRKAIRKGCARLLVAATGFREETINWDSWGGLDG